MRSKYEKQVQKELEAEGYQVDWKLRAHIPMRGYSVDYWGLFDLLAYKPNFPLRFIAVKGHGNVPSALRKGIENFFPTSGISKEIWRFNENRKKEPVKREVIG